MDTKIYKIVPFSEVSVGQEFEDAGLLNKFSRSPWVKEGGEGRRYDHLTLPDGCLLRIADCAPDDFDMWWDHEGMDMWITEPIEAVDVARRAWKAARASPESAL